MKLLNLFYRSCVCLTMTLAICHPTVQLTATHSISTQENSENHIQTGMLENGLSFSLIPSTHLKGGLWIKMSCALPQEDNESLSMLHQHASFYGTKQFDRENLANQLNSLGLDVEADPYVQSNESETILQFSLSEQQGKETEQLLHLIQQMMLYPTLKNNEIELARNHLLANLEEENKDILPLLSITPVELRTFHAQWFAPEKIHLTIIGLYNNAEMTQIIEKAFESPIKSTEEIIVQDPTPSKLNDAEGNMLASLADRIELATDNQTWVIDGKIWMKEPNWINKSSNGRTLGAILAALGIGGAILAFPIAAPIALIVGSLTTGAGIYFLTSDYLKDPTYVEKVRQTDLQMGCAYAYQKHRAGITLTPFERRALFIQEMVLHPKTLPNLPILLLANLYQLNDPIFAEMFILEEFNVLSRLKRDFVQQRNHYKMLKDALEQELASLIAPYALVRDAALLHAKEVYNQNSYVIAKKNLKAERDASIAEVEQAYKANIISLEERDQMLAQAHDYYKACLADPQFKAGLKAAESLLSQMELEIQATYAYQVEICKQSIQYYARMEQIKLGEKSLTHYFNEELISLLSHFPIYLSTLPDYLDLRNL